jgi:hypothetical protein
MDEKHSHSHSHSHSQGLWNLNAIKCFPSHYSLERHHAYISNDSLDLTEIASNVSDCLRAEHVEIVYDQDEAVAYCETSKDASQPDYCKFRINLFKKYDEHSSTSTSTNSSPTILVEVQRLRGCCVHFSTMAKKIICASKGCKYDNDIPVVSNLTIPDFLIQMMDSNGSAASPPMMDVGVAW